MDHNYNLWVIIIKVRKELFSVLQMVELDHCMIIPLWLG